MVRAAVLTGLLALAVSGCGEREGRMSLQNVNCSGPAGGAGADCTGQLNVEGGPVNITQIASQNAQQVSLIGGNGPFQVGSKGEIIVPAGSTPVTVRFSGVAPGSAELFLKLGSDSGQYVEYAFALPAAAAAAAAAPAASGGGDATIDVDSTCLPSNPGSNDAECTLLFTALGRPDSVASVTSAIGGQTEASLLMPGGDEMSGGPIDLPMGQQVAVKVRITGLPQPVATGDNVTLNVAFGSGLGGAVSDPAGPA